MAVSKLERRADMYLSTLRSYIEAMGGRLEIIARFPNRAVRINQLSGHSTRKNGRRGSATNFAAALQTLNKRVAAPHRHLSRRSTRW